MSTSLPQRHISIQPSTQDYILQPCSNTTNATLFRRLLRLPLPEHTTQLLSSSNAPLMRRLCGLRPISDALPQEVSLAVQISLHQGARPALDREATVEVDGVLNLYDLFIVKGSGPFYWVVNNRLEKVPDTITWETLKEKQFVVKKQGTKGYKGLLSIQIYLTPCNPFYAWICAIRFTIFILACSCLGFYAIYVGRGLPKDGVLGGTARLALGQLSALCGLIAVKSITIWRLERIFGPPIDLSNPYSFRLIFHFRHPSITELLSEEQFGA